MNLPSIQQISCGSNFTLCLTNDGYLYSFGSNNYGQLGIGRNTNDEHPPQMIESLQDVEFVICGGTFAFCKTLDNIVYCWGKNTDGQLGVGNTDDVYLPYKSLTCPDDVVDIKCGSEHTLLLTSNRYVYSCGTNQFGIRQRV